MKYLGNIKMNGEIIPVHLISGDMFIYAKTNCPKKLDESFKSEIFQMV